MKKFHHKIILFVLLLAVLVVVAEILLYTNTKTHIGLKYEEIYAPKIQADVVIFGTSHAAHGIKPCSMNQDSATYYNFSFNGGTPKYYLKWYTEIFRPNYPKPKTIIYAVDWAMFDSTWALRSLDVDARYLNLNDFFDILINDHDIAKKSLIWNRSNILYNSKQLQHLFYKKKIIEYVDVTQYCNGYAPQVESYPRMGVSPEHTPVGIGYRNDFNQLLDEIEKDGIDIIFVNVPEYLPAWQTEVIPERFAYLDSISQLRDIPFFNYNIDLKSEFNFDKSLFNNWIHLNDKGAEIFSKRLSNDLNK